jgi:uncharacterized membrane protein YqaE (UPF0057 family)
MSVLKKLGPHPWMIITTNISGILIGITLIYLAYWLGVGNQNYLLNWLVCLLGIVIGWSIGLMVSPASEGESHRFSGLAKALSAFLSGYILSKLDRVIEVFLQQPDRFFQEIFLIKLALFLTAFFLGLVVVYVNRIYFINIIESPPSENHSQ